MLNGLTSLQRRAAVVGPSSPPQLPHVASRHVTTFHTSSRLDKIIQPDGRFGAHLRASTSTATGPRPCGSATAAGDACSHVGIRCGSRRVPKPLQAANQEASLPGGNNPTPSSPGVAKQPSYTLEDMRTLVETAMLAAVSGLAYLVSTILKLENSLGYLLPLPVVLAALRSGVGAGWRTMMATCFLLIVLLGPLRALSYLFLHGMLAATLGSLWRLKVNFWLSVAVGTAVRMFGQLSYLVLSSVAMNENMFALLLSNIYNTLDQISAALGMSSGPSSLAVSCMMFSLLLVNGFVYCFLVHVVYRVVLGIMGYKLAPLPGIVDKYLNAGVIRQ